MKLLIYGTTPAVEKMNEVLSKQNINIVAVASEADLRQCKQTDMALIDSAVANIEQVCQYVKQTLGIPAILIINDPSEWALLSKIEVQGYLPYTIRSNEIMARLNAIARRFPHISGKEVKE